MLLECTFHTRFSTIEMEENCFNYWNWIKWIIYKRIPYHSDGEFSLFFYSHWQCVLAQMKMKSSNRQWNVIFELLWWFVKNNILLELHQAFLFSNEFSYIFHVLDWTFRQMICIKVLSIPKYEHFFNSVNSYTCFM